MTGWIKMSRGMEVGLNPGNIVFDADPSPPPLPPPKKGQSSPTHFLTMPFVVKQLDGLGCHLVWK